MVRQGRRKNPGGIPRRGKIFKVKMTEKQSLQKKNQLSLPALTTQLWLFARTVYDLSEFFCRLNLAASFVAKVKSEEVTCKLRKLTCINSAAFMQ